MSEYLILKRKSKKLEKNGGMPRIDQLNQVNHNGLTMHYDMKYKITN